MSPRRLALVTVVAVAAITSASPWATAESTPATSASAASGGELIALTPDGPATEKSKAPTYAEWSSAGKVQLTRTGPAAARCNAYRVREWLKIRCAGLAPHAMALLGGSAGEVAFWIDRDERKGAEMQFPLRRGDRRVLQVWTGETDAAGTFVKKPALLVQELWQDDRPAPIVTAM